MSFKKQSIKKQSVKKQPKVAGRFFGIIWVCFIFILWIIVVKNISILEFDITSNELTSEEIQLTPEEIDQIDDEEKKQEIITKLEKNKINILLVWRGWAQNDAPELTDTIILASLDRHKKLISMLSLPRDLYVDYNQYSQWKLNGLFSTYYYQKDQTRESAMKKLSDKVTEITGEKIDHYIDVDFSWFTKVIDALGGVEIQIPENFSDDKYPDNNWWYKTLVFRKWTWNMTWERALQYARSRHSTSDFDRSLRQQQVIEAIKRKVFEADYITSPKKIKEFYDIYTSYVSTDIWITDMLDFYPILKDLDKLKMLSYNVNDSCFYGSNTCEKWGFLYIPERSLFNGLSVLLLYWTDITKLSAYDDFKRYSQIIFNRQEFFIEHAQVNIFNSTRTANLAWVLSNDMVSYWFNIPKINSIWNTPIAYEKSVIYYNQLEENSASIKLLKTFFDWEFIKVDTPKYSKDPQTRIEVVIWNDYLQSSKEIFTF